MTPKIFSAHLREMMERFDPRYHSPIFAKNLERVKQKGWRTIADCCEISNETWDREKLFSEQFPYIEIAAINTDDGVISSVDNLPTAEAPSRAQMVVRSGDILVSTTRPTRNAIARVPDEIGRAIASTGFAVIRDVNEDVVSADYFFHALRFSFCTMQFDQRSSGGNYPAITKDDLRKTIIPIPPPEVQRRIVAELDAAYAEKRKADEMAAKLLASIDDVVLSELGIPQMPPQDTSLKTRVFTISSRDVADRTFAPAHYTANIDFSKSKFACCPFLEMAKIDPFETEFVEPPYRLVPMDAVSAEYGSIDRIEEICDGNMGGYSRFRDGDVICAKISPCMENGKSAVVSTGEKGLLFGSTEFYVFRPKQGQLLPDYLHLLLRMKRVREIAGCHLSGTTGHQRVTKRFFADLKIPVPPCSIQRQIVEKTTAIREKAKRLKHDAAKTLSAAKFSMEEQILKK